MRNDPLQSLAPSPIMPISSEIAARAEIRLLIKRDDLLQPTGDHEYSGNKVRKLRHNLAGALAEGYDRLLTFGGAYSNHIAAVARAGRHYNLSTIGVIRGEAHLPLNPTLSQATANGMQLHYLDRSTYRRKHFPEVQEVLRQRFGHFYGIPEGGTNERAMKGSGEIIAEIEGQLGHLPDYLAVACGTSGTLAGMIRRCNGRSKLLGVASLKGDFMTDEVRRLLGEDFPHHNWRVHSNYHFGGYARFPDELRQFVQHFKTEHGILLDPIYTSKLAFGLLDLIGKGTFPKGSTVMMIHTGGLQGWAGFGGL